MQSVHDVSELNLLAVLRIGSDFEGPLDFIGETRDGWREHPVCHFPVLALNDLLAQFPRPPIFIEQLQGSREQHDAGPRVQGRHPFLMVDRDIIYALFHEILLSLSLAAATSEYNVAEPTSPLSWTM